MASLERMAKQYREEARQHRRAAMILDNHAAKLERIISDADNAQTAVNKQAALYDLIADILGEEEDDDA